MHVDFLTGVINVYIVCLHVLNIKKPLFHFLCSTICSTKLISGMQISKSCENTTPTFSEMRKFEQ